MQEMVKLTLQNYDYIRKLYVKDFSDVTLVCEDGQIQSQKLILSESSKVFKKMLSTAKNVTKLQLNGITVSEMTQILNLVYKGEIVVDENEFERISMKGRILEFVGFSDDASNKGPFLRNSYCSE